jgi:dTMP kinase
MSSLFIVFEGIDGSGTSTQAQLLKDYFLSVNKRAILSPEPTQGPIGKLLREALKTELLPMGEKRHFDEQMAYLFASDRHYHLYNKIDGVYHLLSQGIHVLTPRYYFSSLAYNCSNLEEYHFVSQLNQRFPPPDLVIYLDIPVAVSLERLQERQYLEVYENAEKLSQVKQNYEKIFANYPAALLKIDGTANKLFIHQIIQKYLQENFCL